MGEQPDKADVAPRPFLTRLARDKGGNTLAIMGAMLIPMTALTGSAIDMARIYLVRVRLQQACDAGVLAGRKFMVDSTATTLDTNASTQATNFFNNNFRAGWMQTNTVSFTPAKTTDNQVSGTASATVPMALMGMFGAPAKVVNVTCEARYNIDDTDVMFVLDTTGSMSCLPGDSDSTCNSYLGSATSVQYNRPADGALGQATGSVNSANDSVAGYPNSLGFYITEKSGSRISALRTAVVDFYNSLQANVQSTTHVRYGFVTYTSTVNAGAAVMDLNAGYMVGGGSGTNNATYQSRTVTGQYLKSTPAQTTAYDATVQASCNTTTRTPAATASQPYTFDASSQAVEVVKSWNAAQSGTNKCKVVTSYYGPIWTYQPVSYDVSNFISQTSITDPSKLDGSTTSWQGCIEERQTTAGTTSFSTASLPADLDPDLVPNSDATRWKPMWPEVIYYRNFSGTSFSSTANVTSTAASAGDTSKTSSYNNTLSPWYYSNYVYPKSYEMISCGKPVRRLSTMTLQDIKNYVNAADFRPIGNTYHDTGMIWGVRMLSPNGIFANDTAAWPGKQAPTRVIVFLTDGDMAPTMTAYGMYGNEYLDKRVTGGDYANQTSYHNARFLAECAKAKALNIVVYTVTIGPSVTTQMQQCASSTDKAYYTTSGSDLSTKFQAIASQVAKLRLSR